MGIYSGAYCLELVCALPKTNISPEKSILKIVFLFQSWDMLVPWRVMCNNLWLGDMQLKGLCPPKKLVGISSWWFFTPTLGNMSILTNMFQLGWNHQPDLISYRLLLSISFLGSVKGVNRYPAWQICVVGFMSAAWTKKTDILVGSFFFILIHGPLFHWNVHQMVNIKSSQILCG